MARLIIHCGFPKTATTTLQQHVFPKLSNYLSIGTSCNDPDKQEALETFKNFFQSREMSRSLSFRKAILDNIANIVKSNENILISLEIIIGRVWHSPSPTYSFMKEPSPNYGSSFAEVVVQLQDLINLCGITDTRLIFTLREQFSFLSSFYAQTLPRQKIYFRRPISFSDYISWYFERKCVTSSDVLNYCFLEKALIENFGEEKIHLLSYEWMKTCPDLFVEKLAFALSCSKDELGHYLSLANRENVRRLKQGSHEVLKVNAMWGRTFMNTKNTFCPNFKFPYEWFVRDFLNNKSRHVTYYFDPNCEVLDKIKTRYRDSNLAFIQKHPDFASSFEESWK